VSTWTASVYSIRVTIFHISTWFYMYMCLKQYLTFLEIGDCRSITLFR